MYPKAFDYVSVLAPSAIHAEFEAPPKCRISLQSPAFSRFQPLKSPTRFHEDPIELTTAALLAAGAFIPILSALGSLMGIGTFAITWSFFFSTPGVVKWSVSTDPIAWHLTGEFLYKDLVLLFLCIA